MNRIETKALAAHACLRTKLHTLKEEGQGTTEYAILVGVLAVIAMIAIIAFKDKIQELWDAIQDNINDL